MESNVKQNEKPEVERSGYILLNDSAVKNMTVKSGDTLPFKYGTLPFAVEITANTFLQQSFFLQGDELRMIGFIEDEKRVAYTGETITKIQAAEQSGRTHVYIPKGNYAELKDSDISQFKVNTVPAEHISAVLTEVFLRTEFHEVVRL